MAEMKEKRINDRPVHPLGIGTWGFGGERLSDGNVFAEYRYDGEHVESIRYSISRGQDHIDTAQFYGAGHTEEIVGKAIEGIDREKVFVATKVWRTHSLRNAVPKAAEMSLRSLGTDYIDLLYVHFPWDAIEMQEYIDGLNDAREAGLTRSIGVSNFTLEQLRAAVSISRYPIVAAQVHYNVTERGPVTAEYLSYCRENDITVVAYRPIAKSMLAGNSAIREVREIAERRGCTPAQVALAWLVYQEGVVTIPKASSREHIDENLGAMDVRLRASDIDILDRVVQA